tara:strand:- start:34164 stop:34295 length:132 start_codon:yes stop_codon:yes gene_type:complete
MIIAVDNSWSDIGIIFNNGDERESVIKKTSGKYQTFSIGQDNF